MSISENIADVGLKLLRKTGPMDKNTFLSPVSISGCLAMAYAGAAGDTKAQMNEVLFPGMTNETVHTEFSEFMAVLNGYTQLGEECMLLRSVNRMYAQQGFTLKDKFKSILHDKYKAELHSANFASEAARLEINSFVSEQTNNKINDLIGPGVLDVDTRLVLINAIYFKADWITKFKEGMSQDMTFYITEQREKKIPMMIALAVHFQYAENDDVQMLGMPYKGNEMMFVAILPKEKYNLESVESNMNGKVMVQLIKSMTREVVNVYLPKFRLEEEFNLNEALKQMGVLDMLSPVDADFSGINGAKNLYVSHVIHKAFIEINETGTEAAAATAVVTKKKSGKGRKCPTAVPKEFQADHPFLFAIVHTKSSNALFIGRYADATDERCCPSSPETDNESSSPDPTDKKARSASTTDKNINSPCATDKKVSSPDAVEKKSSCLPAGEGEMPCYASGPVDDAGNKKTAPKKSYCCCC